jgi:kinesin family protein 18/19
MPSPLRAKHTQKSTLSENMQLNDSLTKELQPIVYTPEDCRKTFRNPSPVALLRPLSHTASFETISSNINNDNSQKMCEVDVPLNRRSDCRREDLNCTFTICEDNRNLKSKYPEEVSLPNNKTISQRYKKIVFAISSFCCLYIALKLLAFFFLFWYFGDLFHSSSVLS